MVLLPVLLSEAAVTIPTVGKILDEECDRKRQRGKKSNSALTGTGKGKSRRTVWKPSMLESMEHFIDIQEVNLFVFF
jgi:hypothetical protein